jgi:hypothetical protein
MAYMVSVVLIQRDVGARSAPPVLKRGPDDRGPVAQGAPAPALVGIRPAASDVLPAVRLGEDLLVSGSNLRIASATLQLESARLDIKRELMFTTAPDAGSGRLVVHVPSVVEDPSGMAGWAIGFYTAAIRIGEPNQPVWTTNAVPVALAPTIAVTPLAVAAGTVTLTVTCAPRLRQMQEAQARLLFGDSAIKPESITTPATATEPTTLTFRIPGVAPGKYLVRLRVDGIDSLPITISGTPPTLDFDAQQTVTVS